MIQARQCEECGAELPRNTPEGLCAKCLLQRGLESHPPDSSSSDEEKTTIDLQPSKVTVGTPPREGRRFGDYQLIRLLGKGGMGAVYDAEHLASGRRVALKVLNHALDSAEARKRFLREGQLAAAINHPNSVYVFGTEEIEGIPVISMELARGGTLKDVVNKRGPLPVTEAVDMILQVMAGLNAAQSQGVLHRDIKPGNCFVDTDGTVKIGDFGLSISTLRRAESSVTVTGSFLGTPAFSSPEQVRGDELDVRADIYAVGVTLYYLLTGRAPFEGDNLVKLLAAVLERQPESPAKVRRGIPQELGKIVLRCLAKAKEKRFKDYDELRYALLPFSSRTQVPAPLGRRFMAFLVDFFLVQFVSMASMTAFLVAGRNSWSDFLSGHERYGVVLFHIVYFTLMEAIRGASWGKTLFGLRVIRLDGNAIGIPKAFVRVLLVPTLLLSSLALIDPMYAEGRTWTKISLYCLVPALIFSTASLRNGFAALHDLATNTKVVLNWQRPVAVAVTPSRPQERRVERRVEYIPIGGELIEAPTATSQPDERPSFREDRLRIGPYFVTSTFEKGLNHEMLFGFDDRLLRKVWIRKLPDGEPPLHSALRDLARPGRLRWLAGQRTPGESWDAYEEVSGMRFSEAIHAPQNWQTVRQWLLDVAEELNGGLKDQTLPVHLTLDRVWIDAAGRTKLLDFTAPRAQDAASLEGDGQRAPASALRPSADSMSAGYDQASLQLFLKQVALTALEGREVSFEQVRNRPITVRLPLHARTFLERLATFGDFETVVCELRSMMEKPAAISKDWRKFNLTLTVLFVLGLNPSGFPEKFALLMREPDIPLLHRCLERIESLDQRHRSLNPGEARERDALELFIAGRFRNTLSSIDGLRPYRKRGFIPERHEPRANQILAKHPNLTDQQMGETKAALKSFLDEYNPTIPANVPGRSFFLALLLLVKQGWFQVIMGCMVCSFLFRGGLLLRIMDFAVVTRDGRPASRLRALIRSSITWSPFWLMPILAVAIAYQGIWGGLDPASTDFLRNSSYFGVLWLILYLAGGACCEASPDRGPQDRMAGTWLVPR